MSAIQPDRRTSALTRLESVLSHDFCPWANRWVYWVKNPMWCLGIAALISILCGVFANPQVFLLTGVILLVLTLGSIWPILCVRGIRCRVEFNKRRIREHESVPVRLVISNRWPWPVWGLSLVNGFQSSSDESTGESAVAIACVAGWSESEFLWEFRPDCRGVYPLQAPTIGTGFPFGIMRAVREVHCEGALIVWPQTALLNAMPDAADARQCEEHLTDRRAGEFGDMLGSRLFREGDSLRRVHWAQTARQREMIVVERQATATTAVRIVLRLDREADRETNERSIRVAASICESLYRQHAYVECLVSETLYVCNGSEAEFRRLMDAFAQIRIDADRRNESGEPRRDRRAHGLFEIVITPEACRPDVQLATGRRIVVVEHIGRAEPSNTRSWLTVAGDADWSRQLSRLWRKACHAA